MISRTMLSTAVLLACLAAARAASCPETWTLGTCASCANSCYWISSSQSLYANWHDAGVACQAKDPRAHLVSVADLAENTFLVETMGAAGPSSWIGLNDIATEGQFAWSDGSAISFTNWGTGQPDDYKHEQDCVKFDPPKHGSDR